MRVVKFRAWSNKWNKMIFHNVDGYVIDVHNNTSWLDSCDDESIELMQYVEKKDIKGKEAFDGDIIRYRDLKCNGDVSFGTAFIFYEDGIMKLQVIKCEIFMTGAIIYMVDEFEIIGNIYENPELLC